MPSTRKILPVMLLALTAGCPGPTKTMPPGYNELTTRTFKADFTSLGGVVTPLGGLDGSPLALSAVDVDLTDDYQSAGIRQVRYPRGSGCAATLDAVFPVADADATAAESYNFETLDRMTSNLMMSGINPIWQAMYDVGAGACEVADGTEQGKPVLDPEQWTRVVLGVADHLWRGGRLPSMIEFLPDGFGAGGYVQGQESQLVALYSQFAKGLYDAFPIDAKTGKRGFRLLAPSLPLSDAADLASPATPVGAFLDVWKAKPQLAPALFSVLAKANTPDEHFALLTSVRAALDSAGLESVGIADVEAGIPEDGWTGIRAKLPERTDQSAWFGAHLSGIKTLEQGLTDVIVADRWGGPSGSPDLFFAPDGTALPAAYTMLPFYILELEDAVRAQVSYDGKNAASDGNGVTVLAARAPATSHVYLIVAAADPRFVGVNLTYQVDMTGLTPANGAWELSRAVIDAGTRSFHFSEINTVYTTTGRMLLVKNIRVPSVHYIELIPQIAQPPEDVTSQPDVFQDDAGAADATIPEAMAPDSAG